MTEFKVGDKVQLTGNEWGSGIYGTIQTVLGHSGVGTPFFRYDGQKRHICPGFEAELVKSHRTLAEKRQDDYRILARASEPWRNPDHYQFPGGVQVIDITRHLSFPLGNVIKYCSRAGKKGPKVEDLQKALKYLEWAIEDAKKESE